MKRLALHAIWLVPLLALLVLVWTFTPASLTTGSPPTLVYPEPSPPAAMRLTVLETGLIHSKQVFAYRGGGLTDSFESSMSAVMIEHPQGRFLIDAGLGRDYADHQAQAPLLVKMLAQTEFKTAAVSQLASAGIGPEALNGIILTHAHWDHVSGIFDFPGVPVLLAEQEQRFIASGHAMASLAATLPAEIYRVPAFNSGSYLGFPRSQDLFGDGSVVLVPVGGHTPGSMLVFVHLPSGKSYAFVGDIAWLRAAIEAPAERPWLARRTVDFDAERVRFNLVHLHHIARVFPQLTLVPAHDRSVLQHLAQWPRFES